MNRFDWLVCFLGLLASTLFANAGVIEPEAGHLGTAETRDKSSTFYIVEYVAAKSPADQAGIKTGDHFTAINGIQVQKMSAQDARRFFNGNIGGIVTLSVQREGAPEQQISVTRRSLLDTFSPAANAGDARAEYYLGIYYANAANPARNYTLSAEWHRKSADQGYAPAEVSLAYLLRHGLGTSVDIPGATALYLKAAKQDETVAEWELALSYLNGEGITQSDTDAFAWFYSAARHDDPFAEQYLGYLYRKGRGVTRDNHAAFAWYYRSALLHDHYAEWNVSYMYEMGYGVKPDIGEALQWAKKAQADLPNNDKLKQQVALLNLRAFLESPDTVSLDTSLLATVFHRVTIIGFILSVGFYLILGVMLAFFGFKSPDAPHRLVLAIGWIVFYIESQFVAVLAIFLEGKILTADRLLFMMALWGALPVIIFSFGSNWNRFWKASSLPWRTQVLYIFGSVAAVIAMDIGYNLIYQFIMGSQLTGQSTEALFMKARDSSWWLTLSTLALVMPAAEEILFRGYLFEALKKRFSDPVVLIATSFIFSLVHFQLNYFFLLFGLGFVLGWAKLKSGSLRLSTLLHALNNSLVLVLAN